MRRTASLVPLLIALALPVAAQERPSFDCAGAKSEAEKFVCADPALMALDRRLAARYAAAVAVLKKLGSGSQKALAELQATQRGWIAGRNDCWKATDKTDCVKGEYLRREADLVARFMLERPRATAAFACEGNPANQVDVFFFATELPGARLEYGDSIDTATLAPPPAGAAASDARYDGTFGRYLTIRGDEATFAWPQDKAMACRKVH
ncbi:lysozyme inhibitor LprI family protein [Reyranella sp.]|uniref:lysozyme inhibitor LprI family protein n=1 Tax=Reyranella sp. TaxID=1929291 RepID=UPI003BAA7452